MSRDDRRQWQAAGTLAELGELTALWLEGRIGSQPGYMPNRGPDPETTGLVGTLAALNRAGFVTDTSQPGDVGPDINGNLWLQRAAVAGFAGGATLDWLRATIEPTTCDLIAHPAKRRWRRAAPGVTVTTIDGHRHTGFGTQRGAFLVADGYDLCSRTMIDALCRSWQVTVYDPEWGRNTLWSVLDAALHHR